MDDSEPTVPIKLDYTKVELRNPVKLDDGRFDCEINHPVHGWIPFTADPKDDWIEARTIFQRLKKGAK